jgi:hypothetical protein
MTQFSFVLHITQFVTVALLCIGSDGLCNLELSHSSNPVSFRFIAGLTEPGEPRNKRKVCFPKMHNPKTPRFLPVIRSYVQIFGKSCECAQRWPSGSRKIFLPTFPISKENKNVKMRGLQLILFRDRPCALPKLKGTVLRDRFRKC